MLYVHVFKADYLGLELISDENLFSLPQKPLTFYRSLESGIVKFFSIHVGMLTDVVLMVLWDNALVPCKDLSLILV